ncbi:DMT family transporter [Ohtaekwangia koreensis]|uniref:Permease of the drug/metabolite transporter (DMT) superfamily n=1 Tax=Ohtaekwangia koreensis TaxID=688867 RepID=A0A1T5LII8_9BACT|nr:DMT family transporter [Ohtaekwangia koreensis]SKC75796.1 Permease of the drug/metabolite transporter (DMT) superfamily [Ohtaekwangia koreensis]
MIKPSTSSPYFIGGIFIALAGAICFSTKAIFVKLAYRDTTIDAVTLLALRMLFALPFFIVSAAVSSRKDDNVKFTTRQWIGVAIVGLLGYYVSSLLDFLGLQYISAGMERLILFIYPTLVLLMSAVFYRQKIKAYQWLALIVTYGGLALAFYSEVDWNEQRNHDFYLGAALIFLCAITYALYIVGSGRLIPLVGAAKFNSYAMTFASAGVLVHYAIVSNTSLLNLSPLVYFYSFAMAIVSTVIPSYLVTEGIKRIGSDNAAIVGSIGPMSTILQAYFFLHEPIYALQITGTILILVGILLIGRKGKQQKIKS